jgi:hypothetical protein
MDVQSFEKLILKTNELMDFFGQLILSAPKPAILGIFLPNKNVIMTSFVAVALS